MSREEFFKLNPHAWPGCVDEDGNLKLTWTPEEIEEFKVWREKTVFPPDPPRRYKRKVTPAPIKSSTAW